MNVLQRVLSDLHDFHMPLNPPATTEELVYFERLVGHPLPVEIRQLYQNHNGVNEAEDGMDLAFRLLSLAELDVVLSEVMHKEWFAAYPDLLGQFLPCWSDDNGNFMVFYISDPLGGRIAYLHHELGFNLRPRFKCLPSFYTSLIQAAKENSYAYATDYPTLQANEEVDPSDLFAFEHCLSMYRQAQDRDRRMFYSYNALYLCPYAQTSALYELLADENPHLTGEVCEVLAARNWTDAIVQLGQVVLANHNLTCGRAIKALGKLDDPKAAEELIRLASQMHPFKLWSVVDALKQHGYTARKIPHTNGKYDTYQVRQEENQEWVSLQGYEV